MAIKTPPARSNMLHTPAGVTPPASETTTVAAGDTIQCQNNGNTIVRVVCTTAGTGTVVALNSANNQAVTLASGENLLGPYDPAVFGNTLTINTTTAIGSVALYLMPTRYANGWRNPFEASAIAADSN